MFLHSPPPETGLPGDDLNTHPTLQKRQTLFVLSTWVLRPV